MECVLLLECVLSYRVDGVDGELAFQVRVDGVLSQLALQVLRIPQAYTHIHTTHVSTCPPPHPRLSIYQSIYLSIHMYFLGPVGRPDTPYGGSGGALQGLRQLRARLLPAFCCQRSLSLSLTHTHTHTHTSTGWLMYTYVSISIYTYIICICIHKYTVSTGKMESDSLSIRTECVLL